MEEESNNSTNCMLVKDSLKHLSKTKRISKHAGTCTKAKCVKNIKCQLPPVRLPNRQDEEIWGVKALPSNFNSVSKPSQVIDNLLKKRQTQHETVTNQVKAQFEAINLDIEAQIRLHSELFKRELYDKESDIKICLQALNLENDKMLMLGRDKIKMAAKVIADKHEQRVKDIETLYTLLQELERLRSSKYKEVLKRAYEDLHKISYNLPYELQQYFEHEILKINQMLLSNLRCYADLQLQLNLQAENSNRLHMQNLDVLDTRWKQIKKKDALIKLNEKKLVGTDCEAMMLQTEQGKIASELFVAKEQNMQEMWNHISPLPISTEDVNLWSKSTQDTVNSLDFFARKLITLYKMAIVQVFEGYFDELQLLTEGMLETGLTDKDDMNILSLEICKPTIERVTRQYSDDLLNLEVLWDSVITRLQSKLQNTYLFLYSVAHLWDSHFQRVGEVKQIVLKDLKNVIQKNDKANQDQEINLNVAIDTLRQAPTEEGLQDALDDVYDILDALQKTYNSHYTAETKVIEKYEKLAADEVEILSAELQQFLHQYPRDSDASTRIGKRASECAIDTNNDLQRGILPHQMKLCEFQVDAVHNWMFGRLREAIEGYATNCREEITQQANQWTSEHVKKLAKRLEIKLAIHTSRYGRVKLDVHDIRLAEIKNHSDRIARHRAGAEKEIEDIRELYTIQETKYQNIIAEYYKKINDINSKMQKAKTSTTIKAYIAEINYNTDLCSQKLSNLIENQENLYNMKLANITATSVKFSKELKLFLEEGNFTYDEAKKITKDLKTFDKIIKKKFNAITKEIIVKERKMFNQVQQEQTKSLQTLIYSLEEFQFSEKAVAIIKNMEANMHTEIYDIKILNNRLEHCFKEMADESPTNLGDITAFDNFESDFNQMVLDLLDIHSRLYQPQPVINVSAKGLTNIPSKKLQKSNSIVKRGNPLQNCDDYATLLFGYEPIENNCFISKICCNLYKSFLIIQSEAKEFYEKHSDIVNEGKIQPSYEEFLKEVLQKCISYHLQSELVWLDLTNEFIGVLQRLYNFFVSYHSAFFEKHHNCHTERFKGKHNQLSTEVMEITKANMHMLNQIHKKLKPLHGYRSNEYLLKELQQEMEEALKQIRTFNINDLLQPYKESQENHAILYESEVIEAGKRLAALHDDSFGKLLNVPIIDQFEEKIAYMTALLQMHGEDDDINPIFGNIEISPKFKTMLTNIRILLSTDLSSENGIAYEDNMQLNDFQQRFKDEYNQCITYVNNIESTWHTDTDTFEKIFTADTQKILKLYAIKYDNPPSK